MERKTITCVICPKSCRVTVEKTEDNNLIIRGFQCKRGKVHAENEFTEPKRLITTTVEIEEAPFNMLPVISSDEVPKKMLLSCLEEVYKIKVKAPIKVGEVIAYDICGSGVDLLAARSMKQV